MSKKPELDGSESEDEGHHPEISSRQWLVLSLFSAVVYAAIAYLIFYFFHERGTAYIFEHGLSWGSQLGIGVAAGGLGAAVIGIIMKRPPVSGVLDDFYIVKLVSETRLSTFDCVQLSLFAGAGEELLFRGAIQPLLGIWITSVIFVGIHGYFKFKSPGHLLFGVTMFGLSMGLGYLFEHAGLAAAMSAHATYDIIMLRAVSMRSS